MGTDQPSDPLVAPGHFAVEVMSGLIAAANRPGHPLQPEHVAETLRAADSLEIVIEPTPWEDVHRAYELALGSLRYADAVYVAAAERYVTALLTPDGRIKRSGALITCDVIVV